MLPLAEDACSRNFIGNVDRREQFHCLKSSKFPETVFLILASRISILLNGRGKVSLRVFAQQNQEGISVQKGGVNAD